APTRRCRSAGAGAPGRGPMDRRWEAVRSRRPRRSRHLLLTPAAARHRAPELLLGPARRATPRSGAAGLLLVGGGRELADDLALVHDEDRVGEREDLLELERDEQD